MAQQDYDQQRFKDLSKRTRDGKEYIDYLFTLTGNYSQLVKVFTGIATAILALPFVSLKTILIILKSGGVSCWFAYTSWILLGLSILLGAFYQLNSVQIVEDEVEMQGKNYGTHLKRLRCGFYVMMAALFAGIFFTILFLLAYAKWAGDDLYKL